MILLNSYEAATKILDRRSATYSSRPSQVMAGKLVGWENGLGMLPYGDRWRKTRKLVYEGMSAKAMVVHSVYLPSSDQVKTEICHMHRICICFKNMKSSNLSSDCSRLRNTYASIFTMQYLPWASFKSKAKEWNKLLNDLVDIPMNFVYEKMKTGDGEPCLAVRRVEREVKVEGKKKELIKYDEALIKWVGLAVIAAGTDTASRFSYV
ncbi:unnamed protein product [Rhizoctonia solani]|uniref:Uncharacterized protein n=1 Tax=Rhizoctonia solani TaxID=456999 RepID=A0A8H2WBJ8_9AGAM|nr:unnamed protein product [Rhizoctonia solani]